MLTHPCPKGHQSTEVDYCSECGAKIQGSSDPLPKSANYSAGNSATNSATGAATGAASQAVNHSTAPTFIHCPDCATPHDSDSGDFCEICGYNFATGAHGEIPVVVSTASTDQGSSASIAQPQTDQQQTNQPQTDQHSPSAVSATTHPTTWELLISIDPTLALPESPPPPNQAPFTIALTSAIALIGRTSSKRAIYPEISLDFDEAISHRHALLTQQADGTLLLRDIGSSNGTFIRDQILSPMVDVVLREGDEFTLGHWTRIRVKFLHGRDNPVFFST